MDMNGERRMSMRSFIKAIKNEDYQKLKTLLYGGHQLNATDYDGNTLLHHAVTKGDTKIMAWIICSGGDMNAANNGAMTPYDIARTDNFIAGMEMLLDYGAEIYKIDDDIYTYPRRIVDLYYRQICLQVRDSLGRTALHVAVATDDIASVRQLLVRGADATVVTCYREETALHLARSFEVAKLLLDYGACVNAPDRYAVTPFSAIAVKNQPHLERDHQSRMIELFLLLGAEFTDALLIGELSLDYTGNFASMEGLQDVFRFMALNEYASIYNQRVYRDEFRAFYRQLVAEVHAMRNTTFYCNVSFYQFLVESCSRRTTRIDDLRVAKVVEQTSFAEVVGRHPLYREIMTRHVKAACERNETRENAAFALTVAFPQLQSFEVVTDNIVSFLSMEDMCAIAVAYGITKSV